MQQLKFILVLLVVFNCHARVVDTVLGPVDETNPTVLKILDSKAIQRLKYIDQSGPSAYYIRGLNKFSRYDHSVGVYALLKRYDVSLEEQIAGLLHDASHTAFSHVSDWIFQTGEQRSQSYQDNIHDVALRHLGVEQELSACALTLQDVSPKNPQFLALEQPYPDMNADRIEYNLHTALIFGDLTPTDVEQILTALKFKDNKWYFTNAISAKKFAKLSTYYNRSFWGSADNQAIYSVAVGLLKYAMQKNIITSEDLHFGVDAEILFKLGKSKSKTIQKLMKIINNIDQHYKLVDGSDYDLILPVKMRGIDPLVLQQGKLQRLSALSIDFKNELALTQEYCDRGVRLKFIALPDDEVRQLLVAASKN